jgi:hypothetical protein
VNFQAALRKNANQFRRPLTTRQARQDPDEPRMPPIITIDTAPSPLYIDAHQSTYTLTTLLNDNQLILLEIQGTLEYNLQDNKRNGEIKLGDISWDATVWQLIVF